jgi:GR25 family glycosyltransferase involved in LPS biosynthesis
MENIDRIYYINLDHRTDRRQEFEKEIQKLAPLEKVERIQAVHKPELGCLGCTLSHVKTLDTFLKSDYKTCLVFEDDFMFNQDMNYCQFLLKHLFTTNTQFDMVMLGGKVLKDNETESPFLHKVLDAQTSSAYLITKDFAKTLHRNLSEGAELLEQWFQEHNDKKHEYCLDIYWKQLQPQHKWFVFHPKMGIQREGFSDIEKKVTNYGV